MENMSENDYEIWKTCPFCNNWTKHDACPFCKKLSNTRKVINERLMDDWRKMICEKLADQNYDCPDNQNGNCLDCRYGGISDEEIEYYKLYGKLKAATICNSDENMVSIIKSKGGNWIGLKLNK